MRTALVIFSLLTCLSSALTAPTGSLTEEQLLRVRFEPRLNSPVSLLLTFRDESGQQVHLADYFGQRPVVLMLGYYGCPMLCTLALNGATEAFQDLKWTVGEQFEVIFVSIDPQETPALAAEKKRTYLRLYRRGNPDGWHFLTADGPTIQTLADQIGFRFAYDLAAKQFAHPSGFVVLTPTGNIARYFSGVTFSPKEVDAALHAAAANQMVAGSAGFTLLCFQHAPWLGKYGHLVMTTVRVGGVATVLSLGVLLLLPGRRKPGK